MCMYTVSWMSQGGKQWRNEPQYKKKSMIWIQNAARSCWLLKSVHTSGCHVFISRKSQESRIYTFIFVNVLRISHAKTEIKLTPRLLLLLFSTNIQWWKFGVLAAQTVCNLQTATKIQQLNRSEEWTIKKTTTTTQATTSPKTGA